MKIRLKKTGTKDIEDKAIKLIHNYLIEKEGLDAKDIEIKKRGVDIIAKEKWIEAKGCMKKETNIRVVPQSLDFVAENGNLRNYYIYYVYNMQSKNPKLKIFDYKIFKKYRTIEFKYIIQPSKIKEANEINL